VYIIRQYTMTEISSHTTLIILKSEFSFCYWNATHTKFTYMWPKVYNLNKNYFEAALHNVCNTIPNEKRVQPKLQADLGEMYCATTAYNFKIISWKYNPLRMCFRATVCTLIMASFGQSASSFLLPRSRLNHSVVFW
jgi:hypothetical protein